MRRLAVLEEDLDESFIRSRGPGGQNVNKTATCVVLLHRPSGILVKCQATRYQGRNRILARELLLDKLESQRAAQARTFQAQQEKVRRQKRGRSRAAKERILADKARRSSRKADRRHVPGE
jgi:peptide chain release factor